MKPDYCTTRDMLKLVLLLCAVAGFNARPLKHNARRIIGAPQLVHDEQGHIGNSAPAKQHREETEPQWEVVLDPVHAVMTQENMKQKVASIEEKRQGTEPSRRFLVDLNTGLLKEYISEMDRRAEGFYKPAFNPGFRQGTQDSRVTLVDVRTGKQLPELSEMQRRASPLPEFRQDTEYNEATLMKLRMADMMKSMENTKDTKQETTHKAVPPEFRRQGTEPSRRILVDPNTGLVKEYVSEMERRVSGFYNPASNPGFRQATQNSRVTLVDVRRGQPLPELSEMQRRAVPEQFRQGTEHNLRTLMNFRNEHLAEVGNDKTQHTVQDMASNEVYPEYKRGIEYSQSQRQHLVEPLVFQESNEVDNSSPLEEYKHHMEYRYANVIDTGIMKPYVK